MKWSLLELRKYQETPLTFHETLDLKAELMERDNLILDVAPVAVQGLVSVDKKGYLVHYTVQTTLTVPSTRSLEPVELPMDFTVDELFMTKEQYQLRDDQLSAEEILLIEDAKLDLTESIEDNILLEIKKKRKLNKLILVLQNYRNFLMNHQMKMIKRKIGIYCIN